MNRTEHMQHNSINLLTPLILHKPNILVCSIYNIGEQWSSIEYQLSTYVQLRNICLYTSHLSEMRDNSGQLNIEAIFQLCLWFI